MSYIEQNAASGRILLPDMVRAFALLGIVLVNVAYFAYPGAVTYHAGGLNSVLDHSAYFAVNTLFLFKSYPLFSFMFGVGLAYQMASAEKRGAGFGASYFRRLLGLLVLGILHVSLAFVGDILMIYAILGSFLYLFRNASQKTLLRTGLALVVIQVLISGLMAAAMMAFERFDGANYQQMLQDMSASMATGNAIYLDGTFAEISSRRWLEWSEYIAFAVPMQSPGVFGFFLLGLASVRAGVLENSSAELWTRARSIYFPLGLVISLLGSYMILQNDNPMSGEAMFGTTLILIGAPFSSIGYIGLLAKWSQGQMTTLKLFLARAGTSSLTAYLLQSVILSWVFCSYGLGLYSKVGAAGCVSIALVTGLATLCFSSFWRLRFRRGPMEELLRRWTYL